MNSSENSPIHEEIFSREESEEVHMSIFWHGGKLGISYYDVSCHQIFNMIDTCETAPDFDVLRQVLYQIQPNYVILSAKADQRLLVVLRELGVQFAENEDNQTRSILMSSVDFGLDSSKRRIANLQLPDMPKLLTVADRAIYLSSLIDFQYTCMVRALGGLLRYLDKYRIGVQLEEKGISVPVIALCSFSLENTVAIDENTFRSLQIFQQECHPSVYKVGKGEKEGLSLYGILNRCKSVIGRKTLKLMMLRPSTDINVIKHRQNAISYFLEIHNSETVLSLQKLLTHIKNLPNILGRMAQAEASIRDWKSLYSTLYNAILIGDIAKMQSSDILIFKQLREANCDSLPNLVSVINNIVDFEESTAENHFVVKWGIDADLDRKKQNYNGLPELMSKVAKDELQNLNQIVSSCCVVYLPQLGYLLEIPMTPEMEATGSFDLPNLELVFTSNKMVYYRSERTNELLMALGDAQHEIKDHETKIMINLQEAILEHGSELINFVSHIAELDCLIAMSLVAKDHNYTRPCMTNNGLILVKEGRHPLQELCVNSFVPNDISSGHDVGKLKLITGPNTSGKSVYLKQVALIIYLAHIGCFVPANQAEISVMSKIFTRIHALESISTGLSTFMTDINQMAYALNHSDKDSLVIIDEFGIGTDYTDGIGLLAACLNYWLGKGAESPHLFMTTHFHNVLTLIKPDCKLELLTMGIMQEKDELIYLYQLTKGHAQSSFALQVAKDAGLDEKIIGRAKEITQAKRQHKQIPCQPELMEMDRYEAIVSQVLKLNIQTDDLDLFLKNVVLPLAKTPSKT